MSLPQSALFIEQTAVHLHVEFSLDNQADDADVVVAVAAARAAATWLGGPNVVWGFAPSLWRRLSGGRLPKEVRDFVGIGPDNAAIVKQKLHDSGVDINFTQQQLADIERLGGRASDLESVSLDLP